MSNKQEQPGTPAELTAGGTEARKRLVMMSIQSWRALPAVHNAEVVLFMQRLRCGQCGRRVNGSYAQNPEGGPERGSQGPGVRE